MGNGHYKFVRRGTTLSGVGVGGGRWGGGVGVIEDTTCYMNITDQTFLALRRCLLLLLHIRSAHFEILGFPMGGAH